MGNPLPTSPRKGASPCFHVPAVTVPKRKHVRRAVLLWQAHGSSTCVIQDEPHTLTVGYALWIPTRHWHTLEVEPNSIVLPLMFTSQPTSGELREPTWVAVDADLQLQLLALVQTQNSIIQPDRALESKVMRSIMSRVVASPNLPLPISPEARAIALHLQKSPADERSIADLAATQHVSARTVERAFLSETGLSLHAWRTQLRMEVAGALLRSMSSVELVAQRTGYQSLSAFRRTFKKHYAATPSEYARRSRAAA